MQQAWIDFWACIAAVGGASALGFFLTFSTTTRPFPAESAAYSSSSSPSSSLRLKEIRVRSAQLVDSIAFVYADGSKARYGGNGGSDQEPFVLGRNEKIVEIRGRQGTFLDAVEFVTNTGRCSEVYGNRIDIDAGFPFVYKNERGIGGLIATQSVRGWIRNIRGVLAVGNTSRRATNYRPASDTIQRGSLAEPASTTRGESSSHRNSSSLVRFHRIRLKRTWTRVRLAVLAFSVAVLYSLHRVALFAPSCGATLYYESPAVVYTSPIFEEYLLGTLVPMQRRWILLEFDNRTSVDRDEIRALVSSSPPTQSRKRTFLAVKERPVKATHAVTSFAYEASDPRRYAFSSPASSPSPSHSSSNGVEEVTTTTNAIDSIRRSGLLRRIVISRHASASSSSSSNGQSGMGTKMGHDYAARLFRSLRASGYDLLNDDGDDDDDVIIVLDATNSTWYMCAGIFFVAVGVASSATYRLLVKPDDPVADMLRPYVVVEAEPSRATTTRSLALGALIRSVDEDLGDPHTIIYALRGTTYVVSPVWLLRFGRWTSSGLAIQDVRTTGQVRSNLQWINDERAEIVTVDVMARRGSRPDRAFSKGAGFRLSIVREYFHALEGNFLRRVRDVQAAIAEQNQTSFLVEFEHVLRNLLNRGDVHRGRELVAADDDGEDDMECLGACGRKKNVAIAKRCDTCTERDGCFCAPGWCHQCLLKWWLVKNRTKLEMDLPIDPRWQARCPTCRAWFCLNDVVPISRASFPSRPDSSGQDTRIDEDIAGATKEEAGEGGLA